MQPIDTPVGRRGVVKGAVIGALAFVVAGRTVMLTASEARAQGVAMRTLKPEEAETLEAIGETLVPDARKAGIAHFVDQQISGPADEALLQARILNVRPPYANFYRAALGAVDRAAKARHGGKAFAALTAAEQHAFVGDMRVGKIDGWQGPPGPFVYGILRSDAVDVVYSTVEGYEKLGVPYMAHILPPKKW